MLSHVSISHIACRHIAQWTYTSALQQRTTLLDYEMSTIKVHAVSDYQSAPWCLIQALVALLEAMTLTKAGPHINSPKPHDLKL
jgi:hypothetical protein